MRKRIGLLAAAIATVSYGTYEFLRPTQAPEEAARKTVKTSPSETPPPVEVEEPTAGAPFDEDETLVWLDTESTAEVMQADPITTLPEEESPAEESPITAIEENPPITSIEENPEVEAIPYPGSLAPHLASSEDFINEILPYFDPVEDIGLLGIAPFTFETDKNKYLDPIAINNGDYLNIEEKWEKYLQKHKEIAKNNADDPSVEKTTLFLVAMSGEGKIAVIDSLLGDERVPEYDRTILEDIKTKIGETLYGIELEEGKSILELLEELAERQEQSQEQGSESSKLYTPPAMLKVAEATQATATTQSLTI